MKAAIVWGVIGFVGGVIIDDLMWSLLFTVGTSMVGALSIPW